MILDYYICLLWNWWPVKKHKCYQCIPCMSSPELNRDLLRYLVKVTWREMLPVHSGALWGPSEKYFFSCNARKTLGKIKKKHEALDNILLEKERPPMSQQQGYAIWLGAKTETLKKRNVPNLTLRCTTYTINQSNTTKTSSVSVKTCTTSNLLSC